jgi:hypothetical protein
MKGELTLNTRTLATLSAGLLCGCLAAPAGAFTLTFSAFASDHDADVSVLDATLALTIDAAAGVGGSDLLVLDLANQTAAPDDYTLSALYLNYRGTADPATFELVTDPLGDGALQTGDKVHAGGFGYYALLLDLSTPPRANDGLAAGASATWEIDLGATGFDELDFGPLSTTRSPHQIAGAAALKFTQGPAGASAFVLPGASDDPRVRPNSIVPEPLSGALVGAACLGLVAIRLRQTW